MSKTGVRGLSVREWVHECPNWSERYRVDEDGIPDADEDDGIWAWAAHQIAYHGALNDLKEDDLN